MITPSFGLTATERVLPRMALDFTTAVLDPRVTFTRTGNTATVTNSSGFVVPINADLPRFDFNPITLACNGLLIEESRVNLLLQSQNINDAAWTKSDTTVGNDVVVSPDGTQNADKLIETATTAAHFVRQNATAVVGTAYTNSIYLKAGERTQAVFQIYDGANFNGASVNLSTGAVTSPPVDVGGTDISSVVKTVNVGNGWYRVTGTLTQVTGTTRQLRITIQNGSVGVYAGDITKGIYVWGAQVEAGAFATSYIPTVASQVTRTADVATMTGTNFSSWFNASEGALSILFNDPQSGIGGSFFPGIYAFSDNTNNNRMILFRNANIDYSIAVTTLGSGQANLVTSALSTNNRVSTFAYKADSFVAAGNGNAVTTDNAGSVPTVNRLYIGCGAAGNSQLCGTIAKLLYYPMRLTNSEVQAFSKG